MGIETHGVITCEGAPLVKPIGVGQRECDQVLFLGNLPPNTYKRGKAILEIATPEGWKRLKIYRRKQWLCPICSKIVLDRRAMFKERWG